jgi:hypothetical protein
MDVSKLIGGGRSEEELEAAMKVLAATIREAGECLLDLQQAVIKLRMARDPRLATTVDQAAGDCLKRAMRR